jgi:hypothetical protein
MGDEDEPDQPADDKDQRGGNEYFLQYFHILLLVSNDVRGNQNMTPQFI